MIWSMIFYGCPGFYWDGHQHFRTGFLLGERYPTHQNDRYDVCIPGFACVLERKKWHSSTKVVLPENENPAGRRRRPFQY